jgi:hypothetical protein
MDTKCIGVIGSTGKIRGKNIFLLQFLTHGFKRSLTK